MQLNKLCGSSSTGLGACAESIEATKVWTLIGVRFAFHIETLEAFSDLFFSNLLILCRNEAPALERRLVVVGVLVRPLGELHFFALDLLVWDQAQQVTDAIETRTSLVV